jgi:hypothetical protein
LWGEESDNLILLSKLYFRVFCGEKSRSCKI